MFASSVFLSQHVNFDQSELHIHLINGSENMPCRQRHPSPKAVVCRMDVAPPQGPACFVRLGSGGNI
jgi:hypothetical protein